MTDRAPGRPPLLKKEFEQRAKRLGITGYSRMHKDELVWRIAQRERSQEAKERRGRKAA